jgi:serine protease Do
MTATFRTLLAVAAALAAASLAGAGDPAPTDTLAPEARAADKHLLAHAAAPMETESGAFLGVETAMISGTLTAQLNLPRRIGLVILNVSSESGAQAAGLKADDILLKFDDQQLIDTYQLAVLIRNHKEGDAITLTYLRGGQEATTRATLAVRALPKLSWEKEVPGWSRDMGREGVQGMLAMMSPAQRGMLTLPDDEKPETRIFKMNTGDSHVSFEDQLGALDLTIVDGHQNLVAKDGGGAVLFTGPVDTPEQRKALPAGVRERYERLESQIKVDMSYKIDGNLKDSNGKTEAAPQQSSLLRGARTISIPTLTLL